MQGQPTSKTERFQFPFNFFFIFFHFVEQFERMRAFDTGNGLDTLNKSHLSSTKNHHCVERVEEANATVPLVAHDLYPKITLIDSKHQRNTKCIVLFWLVRSFVCLFGIGLALSRWNWYEAWAWYTVQPTSEPNVAYALGMPSRTCH